MSFRVPTFHMTNLTMLRFDWYVGCSKAIGSMGLFHLLITITAHTILYWCKFIPVLYYHDYFFSLLFSFLLPINAYRTSFQAIRRWTSMYRKCLDAEKPLRTCWIWSYSCRDLQDNLLTGVDSSVNVSANHWNDITL